MQRSQVLRLPTGESMYVWPDPSGYPRIRPRATQDAQGPASTYSVYKLLLELAWGTAPAHRPTACHFCCDIHACCNPWHMRWGTPDENRVEAALLADWRAAYLPLPPRKRRRVSHPAAKALALQGLEDCPD